MQPPRARLEHAHERSRPTRARYVTPSRVTSCPSGNASVPVKSALCCSNVALFLYNAHPSKGVIGWFQIQRWRIQLLFFKLLSVHKSKNPSENQKSLHLASASDAEVPRLHHGEVGESAAHSVMRETVCAGEDVCTLHMNLQLSSPTTCV